MSDSDSDDLYSNYTSRRYNSHFTKPSGANGLEPDSSDSDEDDDVQEVEPIRNSIKRQRLIESSDEDTDDESVAILNRAKLQTHDEYIEELCEKTASEYYRTIKKKTEEESKNDVFLDQLRPKVQVESGQFTRAKRIIDEIGEAWKSKTPDISILSNDEPEQSSSSLPCTIDVMDLEIIRNGIFGIDIFLSDNFENIREILAEKWGIPIEDVLLHYNGQEIMPEHTPNNLGFIALQHPHPVFQASKKLAPIVQPNSNGIIDLDDYNEPTRKSNKDVSDGLIGIKFQLASRKKPVEIRVKIETTIDELKDLLCADLGDSVDKQKMRLMFDDDILTDGSQTCDQIGIENGDCIDVY